MLNLKKKKKRPTYLPRLKMMGRSTANKYIFKDGLTNILFENRKNTVFEIIENLHLP